MKRLLTAREIQLEEKKILDKVVCFLNDHNLKYFLAGGTLLGAIRHKGFIPWDDDIDISMPREDYDKLQELIKNKNVLDKTLFFHSMELKNLNLPFTKVYNHEIEIYDWRYVDKYEKYLWIDIFPIDGLPSDMDECQRLFNKRNTLKLALAHRKMSNKYVFYGKSFFKNVIKFLLKYFYKILPERLFSKKIINLTKNYPYKSCEVVGCFVWGYGPQEALPKDLYEDYILVEFEGSKYNGLKSYDRYLTNLYKDYMQLPPEDKRVTHSFKAWRNNEKD